MSDSVVFRQLQARFDTESVNHPGFLCWGAFGIEADWQRLPSPHTDTSTKLIAEIGFGPPWTVFYQFWGSPTVSDLSARRDIFYVLCRQAGDRLLQVPQTIIDLLSINVSAIRDPLNRWLQFVFALGWSKHLPELSIYRSRPFDHSLLSDPTSYSCEVNDIFAVSAQTCGWIALHVDLSIDGQLKAISQPILDRARKSRMKREVANPMIAAHLCRRPNDTAAEVKAEIGCSIGLVSESPAWKANRLRLQDAKNRNCDPIALPLEDYISAGGSKPNSQRYAHRAAQESRDDELDAQEKELFGRIGNFVKANPEATDQEAAAALGCTAGDVERRQATLDQLAQEQVESAREDTEHPEWDEKEGKPKPQKWIKKQV